MFLVDTNVLSELPKRKADPSVVAWFSRQQAITVSAITIEEISCGVRRARPEQAERLQRWFERLLAIPPVILAVDEKIAHAAGQLRAERDRAGRGASQADMLIAATALVGGLTLVTRNLKDFQGCGIPLFDPFRGPCRGPFRGPLGGPPV
jgi:predicted nucleic acid-binding protein